eukprot:6866312-Pyramimonas_sp.AAC.1
MTQKWSTKPRKQIRDLIKKPGLPLTQSSAILHGTNAIGSMANVTAEPCRHQLPISFTAFSNAACAWPHA